MIPTCKECGSTTLLPSDGPRWMGRLNARIFNTTRCGRCGAYVNADSGEPVLPLFRALIALQAAGVLCVLLAGCFGLSRGGSPEAWFGVPIVILFVASFAAILWVARTHHHWGG